MVSLNKFQPVLSQICDNSITVNVKYAEGTYGATITTMPSHANVQG